MKVRAIAMPRLRINQHNSVYLIMFVVCLATWLYKPGFLSSTNILSMLRQASALGVLTAGQLFVIIAGGVDLSVAATMQMGIVIYTRGFNLYGAWGLAGGIGLALLVGAAMGVVNGVIVTRFRVQPFLATLFTGSILTGIRQIVTGISSAGVIPDPIRFLGRDTTAFVPNAVLVFLIITVACLVIFNRTVFGRQLVAVGTNKRAAIFSGIDADRTVIKSYCASGVLAVLSSMLLAGYTGYADMWLGSGFEFSCLVAAVIGGNYLGGGRGSMLGAVGGVLVTTLILNAVLLFGLDIAYQYIAKGMVLVAATLAGALALRKA
jgi:ribose/xylose/arabinose/galactoside ABC-type transport system permease subunit